MIEDISGTTEDGQEVAVGTPEGNALLRAIVEEGLSKVEDVSVRAYHTREWESARLLRRDTIGVLENPGGFNFSYRLQHVGLKIRTPHLFLEPMWTSPYGFADDLASLLVYLRPFVEHPRRRFIVTYWVHRPHARVGTSVGAVLAAVAGAPHGCAIRWDKNGPYVGTAIPNPEEHGPEYVCDVPGRTFLNFHVYEFCDDENAVSLDVTIPTVETPQGSITDVMVHVNKDEDPEAVSWTDTAGRHERAKLIDFVMATGMVRPDLIALAHAVQREQATASEPK